MIAWLSEMWSGGTAAVEPATVRDAGRLAQLHGASFHRGWGESEFEAMLIERNTLARARRNATHHYNIDYRIYRTFLDSDLQYSCAYFEHNGASLDQAQLAKMSPTEMLKKNIEALENAGIERSRIETIRREAEAALGKATGTTITTRPTP